MIEIPKKKTAGRKPIFDETVKRTSCYLPQSIYDGIVDLSLVENPEGRPNFSAGIRALWAFYNQHTDLAIAVFHNALAEPMAEGD